MGLIMCMWANADQGNVRKSSRGFLREKHKTSRWLPLLPPEVTASKWDAQKCYNALPPAWGQNQHRKKDGAEIIRPVEPEALRTGQSISYHFWLCEIVVSFLFKQVCSGFLLVAGNSILTDTRWCGSSSPLPERQNWARKLPSRPLQVNVDAQQSL